MKFREYSPEWITKDMVQEISHKDYLYKKAKVSQSRDDWDLFLKKKNEVKKLLGNAKEEFVKNKIDEHKNNPRKFWRIINEMSGIGKNKSSKSNCSKLVDDDGNLHENQDAADYLNNYYVNVGPNLANSLNMEWDKKKCKIDVDTTFAFSWVTKREVVDLIKNIKICKSCVIEGMSTRIMKDAFLILSFELTYLYNMCLQNGIFPKSWCISMVTPIPKTKTKSKKAGDWRPISQISLPAINIYKCMIRPHLDYIDFVVDSGNSNRIKKLDRLQDKAIRRIEYCYDKESRKDISVLQEDFNIESLSLRRKRNLVKLVHKTSKDKVNVENSRPNIDLRSKPKVKLKSKFTSITKVYNSPLYRGIRLWDQLPLNLQKEENNIKFKNELNRFKWD